MAVSSLLTLATNRPRPFLYGENAPLSDRNSEPQRASRPFDRKRDGFVMGEGGCILVVEELERAKRRGAHIYAELIGWAVDQSSFCAMTAVLPAA